MTATPAAIEELSDRRRVEYLLTRWDPARLNGVACHHRGSMLRALLVLRDTRAARYQAAEVTRISGERSTTPTPAYRCRTIGPVSATDQQHGGTR